MEPRVSIHAFRGEGDLDHPTCIPDLDVSIHAFRGEGDYNPPHLWFWQYVFQSTPSGGKATTASAPRPSGAGRFNPRLPGGRRPTRRGTLVAFDAVSIHAFRGEGDGRSRRRTRAPRGFNPRLPGGRRRPPDRDAGCHSLFQSTPSGGKATTGASVSHTVLTFQSTPSGGKATGIRPRSRASRGRFNPRLPGGRRPRSTPSLDSTGMFQSTPSGGKATRAEGHFVQRLGVSIHAFRGEGDFAAYNQTLRCNVSIHAFRGEGDRNI